MTIHELIATNKLMRLKSRYCQRLDGQRWADWREPFTDDARYFFDNEKSSTTAR